MDLYLQLGHGMMAHSKELMGKWNTATSILSPKNNTLEQMIKLSSEIKTMGNSVLIDPQFYIPRTSQDNLHSHSFWPQNFNTGTFFSGPNLKEMLNIFKNEYVDSCNASAFIIPTLYLSDINPDWDTITNLIVNETEKLTFNIPKYLTVCVGEDILLNEEKTHQLIENLEDYPVDGFYIIPVHPKNEYLIDNATWMINLLDLIASLKIINKKVIIGYCSHQMLILALAKVDAICSGTWIKTRVFPLDDFNEKDDDNTGGRKSTWYYCPQSLSEYQIPFLDVANRVGILKEMKPANSLGSNYSNILFSGAQPTTVNFSEREAFRHYLQCLHSQCLSTTHNSYEDTKVYLKMLIDTALDLASFFRESGVRAKHRDFGNVGDSCLGAIDAFDNTWGLLYQAKWDEL